MFPFKKTRLPKPGFGVEREVFVPLLQGGCVSEKSSAAVGTLQAAAQPPYSVQNGPIK